MLFPTFFETYKTHKEDRTHELTTYVIYVTQVWSHEHINNCEAFNINNLTNILYLYHKPSMTNDWWYMRYDNECDGLMLWLLAEYRLEVIGIVISINTRLTDHLFHTRENTMSAMQSCVITDICHAWASPVPSVIIIANSCWTPEKTAATCWRQCEQYIQTQIYTLLYSWWVCTISGCLKVFLFPLRNLSCHSEICLATLTFYIITRSVHIKHSRYMYMTIYRTPQKDEFNLSNGSHSDQSLIIEGHDKTNAPSTCNT